MLPTIPRIKQVTVLKTTTLRGFTGGLNLIDDDMNLSYKYSVKLMNCYTDSDGSIRARYGTKLFATIPYHITNIEYFNSALIGVSNQGHIYKFTANGTPTLLGQPWGATEFASFAQFNSHLIICNGVDKPLDISSTFALTYLQDLGTATNINTPVCKYVTSCNRYLVMAGDPLEPNRVHISARDAAGTWYGDPAPNDATRIDVGSVLSSANAIRGLLTFRDKLLVMFAEGTVIGTLGTYDDATPPNHTPDFNDAIEQYGGISHRSGVARGDDGLLVDLNGVSSIQRTVLSTSFKPERVSELIDPDITHTLDQLSFDTLDNRVFSVYDSRLGTYMLFVPNGDNYETTTGCYTYVYNYRPSLKQESWGEYTGWNWTCACRSISGNIFFGDRFGKIYVLGNDTSPVYQDYMGTSSQQPISITWEMPWTDLGSRSSVKNSKYISFDTRGTETFTCQLYVDNILTSAALTANFVGGDDTTSPVRTSYKKLFAFPAKFELAKLKFTATCDSPLKFVSVTMHYQQGSIRR